MLGFCIALAFLVSERSRDHCMPITVGYKIGRRKPPAPDVDSVQDSAARVMTGAVTSSGLQGSRDQKGGEINYNVGTAV